MLTRCVFPIVGLALAAGLAGCENAGEDRVLSVAATGSIDGVVYFDQNGSGQLDGSDVGLANIGIRVIALGTRDTVARPLTASDGSFTTGQISVGRYQVRLATGAIGDSVVVRQFEDSSAALAPDGTALVTIGVGFPTFSVADARVQVPGRKVFVEGVALTSFGIFGDATTHVADGTGAIRATRVRAVTQLEGDSVRLLGGVGIRDGQPVLDDVTVFVLEVGRPIPPPEQLTTVNARGADGGRLDAALSVVRNASITDTATVGADFRMIVDDGSGPLEVVLDGNIVWNVSAYGPGVRIDATGLLVVLPGGGGWQLKPRRPADLLLR